MPEEVTPQNGNTTANEATQIDWESPDNPYAQRYREAQSHLTPVQQENARLRALETDRDAYIALGQKHGFEFELEDAAQQQTQGGQESLAEYTARLEATEAKLARFETQQAEQDQNAQWGQWGDHVEALAKEAGLTLTEREKTWLQVNTSDPATGYPKSPDETVAAFNGLAVTLKAEREQWQREYEESRKRPRVPHTPGGGGADTGIPDYSQMSRADIDRAMAERAMGAD